MTEDTLDRTAIAKVMEELGALVVDHGGLRGHLQVVLANFVRNAFMTCLLATQFFQIQVYGKLRRCYT